MTRISIHQPNYLPWIGFFSKIKNSDFFVILDDVEYSKNSVINRNKIRTKDSWCYVTIPLEKKYQSSLINEVNLPADRKWQKKHWISIESNYKKADFFDSYCDFFKNLYKQNYDYLWEINEKIIYYLLEQFNIDIEIQKSSEIEKYPELQGSKLLAAICNTYSDYGEITYLSGQGGKNYMDLNDFKNFGINVEFLEFNHPMYKQRYEGFVPYMSAIDLLFNMGEESEKYL